MDDLTVEMTTDPSHAFAQAEDYLVERCAQHNLILTLLNRDIASPGDGRYWIVRDGGDVTGFALQSDLSRAVLLSPMRDDVVRVLAAESAASAGGSVPGCAGDVQTAALFAGCWGEFAGERVTVAEGQRLYQLGCVPGVPSVPGELRAARSEDHGVLLKYREQFATDTGTRADDADTLIRTETAGRLYVWDDGGVVSTVRVSPAVAGVTRLGFVYTPEHLRGRGYAAACVAALSARLRESDGLECVLYTQLANPTSNRLYRRLGYEPISEQLSYQFGE